MNTKKEYQMKLYDTPFELIKCGKKTIEVRCNDDKRRKLNVGDKIVFCRYDNPDDKIHTEIVGLQTFTTFRELYSSYPMEKFGNKGATVEDMLAAVDKIYSKEEQDKFGAIAIIIKIDSGISKKGFISKVLSLKKHNTNSTVEQIYENTNKEQRRKIFYGGLKSAERILTSLAQDAFGNTEALSIEMCFQIYLQTWIRSRGGFNPLFSSPAYIKEALCKRFESIDAGSVLICVNGSLTEIYRHEPELKMKVDAIEAMRQSVNNNAQKNAEIENLYLSDLEYGLVPQKPVFVNGFGSDKDYLSHLYTDEEIKLNFVRVGSAPVEGIAGPVDLYRLLLPDGTEYLQIYVCNYGSSNKKSSPKGTKYLD